MGTLSGWSYYKDITITGQSGAGTDYQVKLTIGDSAGGDFHLEGHCTNFPQDIRITDDDGTTLLDHFVEDITADPIKVWVKIKDDLGSNQTIRVYYGKSGETTASNGANTFIQYHGSATAQYFDTEIKAQPLISEHYIKITTSTHDIRMGVCNNEYVSQDSLTMDPYSPNNRVYFICYNNGSTIAAGIYESPTLTLNQYYKIKTVATGTSYHGYVDTNEIGSGFTSSAVDENMGLFVIPSDGTFVQDWAFIRKYNSPEPAFSSAGAEQSISIGWSDKIIGVSSPGKVNGIAAADISKILGVS